MATPEGAVRTVARYFAEGHWQSSTRTGPPGKVGAYHRTLSTYLNALCEAALMLERIVEPRPETEVAANATLPKFLIVRSRKGTQNPPTEGEPAGNGAEAYLESFGRIAASMARCPPLD